MALQTKYPENSVFIIGGGHFGGRAASILCKEMSHDNLFLVECDKESLIRLGDIPVHKIEHDGIDFLVIQYPRFDLRNTVVPAVPVHLAFQWLKAFFMGEYAIHQINTPQIIRERLPHPMDGSEGSVLTSYADFICPDDCPEPESCTVTGEKREVPLYRLMGDLKKSGFGVHVLRSHQLAPGVGGYKVGDMSEMAQRITGSRIKKWILGTSCRCHGIVTSFEIEIV
jgi:hypothetical protein